MKTARRKMLVATALVGALAFISTQTAQAQTSRFAPSSPPVDQKHRCGAGGHA